MICFDQGGGSCPVEFNGQKESCETRSDRSVERKTHRRRPLVLPRTPLLLLVRSSEAPSSDAPRPRTRQDDVLQRDAVPLQKRPHAVSNPTPKASALPPKDTLCLGLKRSERTDLNMPTVWFSTAHRICSRERTLEGAARAIIDPSKGRRIASVVFGPAHNTSGKPKRDE